MCAYTYYLNILVVIFVAIKATLNIIFEKKSVHPICQNFLLKGTVKVGGNLPLKYCISTVLAIKIVSSLPFGLKKVTALDFLFNSEIAGAHF